MSKYGNKKVKLEGYVFDSRAEASRYQELRLMEKANAIHALEVHPTFYFSINNVSLGYYKADFQYWENGRRIVEDVKSEATRKLPVFRLKKKMMLALHGIEVQEVLA